MNVFFKTCGITILVASLGVLFAFKVEAQCVVPAPLEVDINALELSGKLKCQNDGGCSIRADAVASGYQPQEYAVENRLAACRVMCGGLGAAVKLDVGRGDGGRP